MVKDFKLCLDTNKHYCPGVRVQGSVVISSKTPKDYHSITVTLFGEAQVKWTVSSGSGNQKRRTTYINSQNCINLLAAVWKAESSTTGSFPIGEHSFPFIFELPQNLPDSYEGAYGHIRYEVTAKIIQGGVINSLVKSNHVLKACLTVENRMPMSEILMQHSQPVAYSVEKRVQLFCLDRGSVSATVSLSCTGLPVGETIPVSVNINNETTSNVRVAFVLKRRDTFSTPADKKYVFYTILKALSSPIVQGIHTYVEKSMVIPATTIPTMRSCACISVEYFLDVIIKIPLSSNLSVTIPIVITNSNTVIYCSFTG